MEKNDKQYNFELNSHLTSTGNQTHFYLKAISHILHFSTDNAVSNEAEASLSEERPSIVQCVIVCWKWLLSTQL